MLVCHSTNIDPTVSLTIFYSRLVVCISIKRGPFPIVTWRIALKIEPKSNFSEYNRLVDLISHIWKDISDFHLFLKARKRAFYSSFSFRSVLEKYNIQNNDSLIDVFDRMINTGSKVNFTEEELLMFADIERIVKGENKSFEAKEVHWWEKLFSFFSH